jgi:hypothetical protein
VKCPHLNLLTSDLCSLWELPWPPEAVLWCLVTKCAQPLYSNRCTCYRRGSSRFVTLLPLPWLFKAKRLVYEPPGLKLHIYIYIYIYIFRNRQQADALSCFRQSSCLTLCKLLVSQPAAFVRQYSSLQLSVQIMYSRMIVPIPVAARGSAVARLLGLRVRIPPGVCMSVVSVVCCQVEVSATGWSLVQRSPTEYSVCKKCVIVKLRKMRRRRPPRGCRAIGKNIYIIVNSLHKGE